MKARDGDDNRQRQSFNHKAGLVERSGGKKKRDEKRERPGT
jgi:hypothetical protein